MPTSSRLSQGSKQNSKKSSQGDNDLEIGMLPPWSPKKGSNAKQPSWQAKYVVTYYSICCSGVKLFPPFLFKLFLTRF